jgi:hypothetical protein
MENGSNFLACRLVHGNLLSFFFFFFFFENTLGGKIFEFPPKRFRDPWLARGDVGHLMRRIAWSRFGHVSESESSKGGRHNYSPDVGSRSVFGNYEASFSVLRSVFFLGFNACLFGFRR